MTFIINKKPIKTCSLHGYNPNDPLKLNRHPEFLNRGVEFIVDEFIKGIQRGYDRWLIHMIQGSPDGQRLYPSANWYTLPLDIRRDVATNIPQTIQNNLEVFSGFRINDVKSLIMDETIVRVPNPLITADW